jgi:hypothetical protein
MVIGLLLQLCDSHAAHLSQNHNDFQNHVIVYNFKTFEK